jgi:hypothetical protein
MYITASFAPPCSGPFDRRGDHPAGERRRIEAVLCVENHRDFERRHDFGLRQGPEAHLEEVCREPELRIWRDDALVVAAALIESHDARELGHQAERSIEIRRHAGVFERQVGCADEADSRPEDVHRVAIEWQCRQHLEDRRIDGA